LEISTLAFLAARKQNTNKTKKRKPEKELLEHNSMLPGQKVECGVGGATVPWRQRKIARKIKIQLCFALLCFFFS
jgi:hypothetical protein